MDDSLQRDLLRAFTNTDYRVRPGGRVYILRIGRRHPGLDRSIHHAPWAVITPCNPGAERLDDNANADRIEAFGRDLDERGFNHWPAVNRDRAGRWPDEPGRLVTGIDAADAARLGRDWGQLAVVCARAHAPASLVDTHRITPLPAGSDSFSHS